MVKPKQSKLLGFSSKTYDRNVTSPKKNVLPQTRKVPKVSKDSLEKADSLSLHSLKSQASLSTLSEGTESEDYDPSGPGSGWNTPSSVVSSPRQKLSKTSSVAGKKRVRHSQISVISGPQKKVRHSQISVTSASQKKSDIRPKPSIIFKLKKPPSNEKDQAIKLASPPNSSTSSSTESEDYGDAEEQLLDNTNKSEDRRIEENSESAFYLDDDNQMSLSTDLNIRMRFDLLKNLMEIPYLEELSAITTPIEVKELREEDLVDLGIFRNPLAGGSSGTIHPLSDPDYEDITEEAWSQDDPDVISLAMISTSGLESDNDSCWLSQRNRVKLSIIPTFTEDPFGSFENSHENSLVTFPIQKVVQSYLNSIIDLVAERFGNADYERAGSLDKSKLLDRLLEEVDDNYWEKYENDYLIKRLTEYHLRRSKYSLITPSKSSTVKESTRRRYLSTLNELDHWMRREREAEELHLAERDRLLQELEEKQAEDVANEERLEQLIRKTILRRAHPSDRLKFVTEATLRQMRKKRNNLSETRLVLIIKQHNNSYIEMKIDETETISEELKLDTYLSTETDVQQLANTIHSRNEELHRMCALIKKKIHSISHLKCRRKLLNRNFLNAKKELRIKQKQHFALRDKIFACNIMRNKILANIKELRYKGGIMYYPKLLADFDQTEKFILKKRDRVKELKAQHDSLLRKINRVEKSSESINRIS
ncbi:uncharacterized protein LOC123037747 [Drosophila rhopaloa]|uniref:CCDC113/CCDC96 coiled-coil domain-containing protein n=1 Tax=Drosophila rhopaloa TaxID=1041015 RepID=A0ABM5JAM4_DRORH|nr:uncharacterized protein LOC123037747 [Drosophila rhopaloa]